MNYTLVVVDMQANWPAANNPATIAAVAREVAAARALGMAVVMITIPYWSPMDEQGFPRTHRSIRDLITGYDRSVECEKLMWQDGAHNVLNACNWKHFCTDQLRIVGVNTAGCIYAMVEGLAKIAPATHVTVVQDGCSSDFGLPKGEKGAEKWDDSMWSFFEALPNVTLVPGGELALQAA